MEKRTKSCIFPTKQEQYNHHFQQICPHFGQYFKKFFRMKKILLKFSQFGCEVVEYTSSLPYYSSMCFNVERKLTNTSRCPSENIAFQGIFLLKIQEIYQKKNKISSLKNLKNTFGRWVFCTEHKGIKNARNIAALTIQNILA